MPRCPPQSPLCRCGSRDRNRPRAPPSFESREDCFASLAMTSRAAAPILAWLSQPTVGEAKEDLWHEDQSRARLSWMSSNIWEHHMVRGVGGVMVAKDSIHGMLCTAK